jgi:hypothetical protein
MVMLCRFKNIEAVSSTGLPPSSFDSLAARLCLAPWPISGVFVLLGISLFSALAVDEPTNNPFQNAQRIQGAVGKLDASNEKATSQPGEPVHGSNGSGKSVWYRWRAPYPMDVRFTTEGSSIRTVLAIYTGVNLSGLTPISSCEDPSEGLVGCTTQFPVASGTELVIAVDSLNSEEGLFRLAWDSTPANDRFSTFRMLTGPSGTLAAGSHGANVEPFENVPVAADVGGTVWFAWAPSVSGEVVFDTLGTKFDTILAVYKGSALNVLVEVTSNDDAADEVSASKMTWMAEAGARYRLVLGGHNGEGGDFELHWNQQLPPPTNDSLEEPKQVSGLSGQVEGVNLGATAEPLEPFHSGAPANASVWFSWQAPQSGLVKMNTLRSLILTRLSAYKGTTYEDLVSVGESGTGGSAGTLRFQAIKDVQYLIALDGFEGSTGTYLLDWTIEGLNGAANTFSSAKRITGVTGESVAENYYADKEPNEPSHADDAGGKSVWFRWTAPASYRVIWSTAGSNFDTLLAVYTGGGFGSPLAEVESNDNDERAQTSEVTFDATAGTTYQIAVDSSSHGGRKIPAVGSIRLRWMPSDRDFIGVSPNRGLIGSRVTVGARDLSEVLSVTFNGVAAEFEFESGSVTATVPSGATSGPVSLTKSNGAILTTGVDFAVVAGSPPKITLRAREAGVLQMAWSSQYPDFQLEWSNDLLTESDWHPCQTPVQLGGELVVDESTDMSRPIRYFRLNLP